MQSPFTSNPQLIELAQQELRSVRRIAVTGATGFVGSRLAQVLHEAGYEVTLSGRSRWRAASAGKFIEADITRPSDVDRVCDGQQVVIHCAAATSPWGSLADHRAINVAGSKHVIDSCLRNGVQRLVHVSSTAIFFQFRDREVHDDTPVPERYCNAYAQTKAEAEAVVHTAIKSGLNAYIVRARAVFGPGDNALLPRLIAASAQGKLRQIGRGNNRCDLTYIDNLLAGLIRAASPTRPTGVCTITNQQPVVLWQLIRQVLDEMVPGHQAHRSVPYAIADRLAQLSEWKHKALRRRGEPALTRYSVGLLAKEQIFHSRAAQADLDYQPIVSMDEGIKRTLSTLRARTPKQAQSTKRVQLKFFSTGYLVAQRRMIDRSGNRGPIRVHASVALITHPDFGPILFDAGYSPGFYTATTRLPYRLYRWMTPVNTDTERSADAWLLRQQIRPEDLKLILLSHFHGDHICALKAFPNAQILTLEKAWRDARGRTGLSALKRAILPSLIPDDADSRIHTIAEMHWPGIGPFARSHDLFGDGSIRLFDLDGHAPGQMGALLQVEGGKHVFLIADACWSRVEIQQRLEPTLPFRLIAADYRQVLKTREKLYRLASEHPEIEFACTHCPDLAEEQGF